MSTEDPIIAAIEAHGRACAETRAAYGRQSAIESELGAGVRVPAGELKMIHGGLLLMTQHERRWRCRMILR